MKPIHHLNYFYSEDTIYCEQKGNVVKANQSFHDINCSFCPFFAGHLQGEGVECLYEDSTAKEGEVVTIEDPYFFKDKRLKAQKIEQERRAVNFTVKK